VRATSAVAGSGQRRDGGVECHGGGNGGGQRSHAQRLRYSYSRYQYVRRRVSRVAPGGC
jgi:hypothetical protein